MVTASANATAFCLAGQGPWAWLPESDHMTSKSQALNEATAQIEECSATRSLSCGEWASE